MVVAARGGLGNQLHQFLVSKELASRQNLELVFDARHLPRKPYTARTGVTIFPFVLDDFVGFDFRVKKTKWNWAHYPFRFLLALERKLLLSKAISSFSTRVITSDQVLENQLDTFCPNRITSLLGAIRLSEKSLSESRSIFRQTREPSRKYSELRDLQLSAKVIGVHVRRGDYENLSHKYGYISQEWYFSQVEEMLPRNDLVFVFSDSADAAREFVRVFGSEKVVPVGPSEIISSVEVLILLSSCHSLVLSNSTLSRWALVLGEAFDRVVYPVLPERFTRVFGDLRSQDFSSHNVQGSKV